MTLSNELILFIGRFHPVIVHFPIGILCFAFVLQSFSVFPFFRAYQPAARLAWLCGALSAIAACVVGFCLSYDGGYDVDVLFRHQWLSIALAATSSAAYALQCGCFRYRSSFLAGCLMAVSMVLLIITGHYGGSLTHGSNYLFEYAPPGLQSMLGFTPAPSTTQKRIERLADIHLYADVIAPIFADRCLSCHNTEKMQGGLDLSSPEGIQKGGAFGAVIQVGGASQSELFHRITFPDTDESAMPPKGKARVSPERIRLIEWWMDQGAAFDQQVDVTALPHDIQTLLQEQFGLGDQTAGNAMDIPLPAEMDIQSARDQGFFVRRVAVDQPWLEVTVDPLLDSLNKDALQSLSALKDQVIWLNLSGCGLDDGRLQTLVPMPNLTQLNLSHNPIIGSGISHLQSFPKLEMLNLYQTEVSDEWIVVFTRFPRLETLYLGETGVTPNGFQRLSESGVIRVMDGY